VTSGFNIAPLFNKTKKVTLEPQIVNGTPSLSVSGGGISFIGGSVNIDFKGNKADNIIMNISNFNIQTGNTADQSVSRIDLASEYSAMQQRVDNDISNKDDREEIKLILEEIKKDLKLKQIPHTNLEKLRRYEKIYNITQPWVMKALDLILKTGFFNL
jgi:hypothetical protein